MDIGDNLIKYVHSRIDTGSSMCSHSLSTFSVTVGDDYLYMHALVCCNYYLRVVFISFKAFNCVAGSGNYLRVVSNQRSTVAHLGLLRNGRQKSKEEREKGKEWWHKPTKRWPFSIVLSHQNLQKEKG